MAVRGREQGLGSAEQRRAFRRYFLQTGELVYVGMTDSRNSIRCIVFSSGLPSLNLLRVRLCRCDGVASTIGMTSTIGLIVMLQLSI